ncbi:HD domain-containing protein [Streptomyces sp. NPDC014623]|uniref:HD domain-containing protein n=1 Tax=Streptomyces sp. NPDC014623 TaxID=3364875 RepID=UPI0036F9DE0C
MPTPYLTLPQVEALAREAHREQTDKAGRPYAEHLAAVAEGVRVRGGSEEQVAAAWLHDAVEDGVLSRQWLDEASLPGRVKEMVLAVTKRDGEDLFTYTGRILATPGALLIKESDLAHNADPERLAILEPAVHTRLVEKYAQVRALLGLGDGARPPERRDQANPATG